MLSTPGEKPSPQDSSFCQALRQLSNVHSSQLCVRLAAGGDPTYAFNVRLTGEEVHGTSKSACWKGKIKQVYSRPYISRPSVGPQK